MRPRAIYLFSGIAVGLVILAAVSTGRLFGGRELSRQFVPGSIGRESGGDVLPPSAHAFITRSMGVGGRTEEIEWGRNNHLTEPLAFSHNLGRVFPPELFLQHPEFFPLADGRRLQPPLKGPLFWNPDLGRADVARYSATAAREFFSTHPAASSFALGVNDALIFGESPENLALIQPEKWFRERPDYSNLVFTFMNRAAEELGRTHPDKYLGALAYYWAENVPDFPLNPQIVPFLTADRAQGYDEKFRDEEFHLQDRWAKAGPKRLGLYDYLYGGGYLIPRIYLRLLAENLRHARRAGFTDYNAEANPNWGLDGPMPWLAAQLLQDPEQPVAGLLDEYYRRYFKESAEPMRRFFELCEDRWMGQAGPPYWLKHFRNESQATLFPTPVCRQMRELLAQAESHAAGELVRERVKLVSGAFGVTERFVAFNEARDQVSRRALAADKDWRPAASALRTMLSARHEFIRYTTNLRQVAPLAVAPFGWDDYLKNDPVGEALLAISAAAKARGEVNEVAAMIASWAEPMVTELWRAVAATPPENGSELLRNNTFVGPSQPARRIAGLDYGVALPSEWTSKVEPAQFHRAELQDDASGRVLRITGSKDTSVSQWDRLSGAGLSRAEITMRGHVSPGTIVSLMLAWLDVRERHVGFKVLRLPDGDWPEWVTLQQAGLPPVGAVWVGMGLQVQNQVAGDSIEARDFHLLASP